MRLERARAVLFDKDGTLFDFQKSWAPLGARIIAEFSGGDSVLAARLAKAGGFDLVEGRFLPESPLVSASGAEIATLWAAVLSEAPAQALSAAEVEDRMNQAGEAAAGLAPAASDLPGLLGRLAGSGRALGVATNDAEAPARAQLARAGALQHFSFIAGYDSGVAPKPHPAMVLAFATAVGAQPSEVVMVGDSLHDMRAAKAAGALAAVAVLTGPAPREILETEADLVLESIEDLPEALGL